MEKFRPVMYKLHSLLFPIESPEEVVDLLKSMLQLDLSTSANEKKWILTYEIPSKDKEVTPVRVQVELFEIEGD